MYVVKLPDYGWHKAGSETSLVSRLPLEGGDTLKVTLRFNPLEGPAYTIDEAVIVDGRGNILEYVNPHLITLCVEGSPVATRNHPLWDALTTREVEALFGLANEMAKRACQRGRLPCRNVRGAWFIHYDDAAARWG